RHPRGARGPGAASGHGHLGPTPPEAPCGRHRGGTGLGRRSGCGGSPAGRRVALEAVVARAAPRLGPLVARSGRSRPAESAPSPAALFCDYYNREGQCEWHYQPCGPPCMRTCRNPSGRCLTDLPGLEGCYPKCPPEAPIFDEDRMQCVATCPAPPPPPPCRVQGKSYRPGEMVPSDRNCQSCVCSESGVQCVYDTEACVCTYDGRRFRPGDVIYHTTDGTGGCISARCSANGTIDRTVYPCSPTTPTPPTTFSFSTSPL
uniref:mucin-5AC-like n=1 Tax=Panthera onca TaxID=9690 RepID=UPI002953C852